MLLTRQRTEICLTRYVNPLICPSTACCSVIQWMSNCSIRTNWILATFDLIPAFTLGGLGGGTAWNVGELVEIAHWDCVIQNKSEFLPGINSRMARIGI